MSCREGTAQARARLRGPSGLFPGLGTARTLEGKGPAGPLPGRTGGAVWRPASGASRPRLFLGGSYPQWSAPCGRGRTRAVQPGQLKGEGSPQPGSGSEELVAGQACPAPGQWSQLPGVWRSDWPNLCPDPGGTVEETGFSIHCSPRRSSHGLCSPPARTGRGATAQTPVLMAASELQQEHGQTLLARRWMGDWHRLGSPPPRASHRSPELRQRPSHAGRRPAHTSPPRAGAPGLGGCRSRSCFTLSWGQSRAGPGRRGPEVPQAEAESLAVPAGLLTPTGSRGRPAAAAGWWPPPGQRRAAAAATRGSCAWGAAGAACSGCPRPR